MSRTVEYGGRIGAKGRIVRKAILLLLTWILTSIAVWSQDLGQVGSTSPVKVSGAVNTRAALYESDRAGRDRDLLSGIITGSLSLDLYGLNLPFSFALSTDERNFSQPFNQFGVSPRYKWVTAHVGHRNLTYSPWTLAGHQIFGVGAEIAPGPFRASFITGRLNRAVVADTVDSLTRLETGFDRSGTAVLIGYETDAFEVELSGLKASDDTTGATGAEILAAGSRPAENIVGSLLLGFRPMEGLRFRFSAGLSEYTRDVRSETITLNDAAAALGELQEPRASTQVYTGLKGEMTLNVGNVGLRADYSRIDPDFQSMGAYYSSSDVEAISVAPSVALADRKLRLRGEITWSHDNVTGKKMATTRTLAPSLNVDWSPSRAFGLSINGSTRMISQTDGTVRLSDTTRMDLQTPSITIAPRYSIVDTSTVHSFSMAATHQQSIDGNELTRPYTEYNSTVASLSWTMTKVRSGLSVNASTSMSGIENNYGSQSTLGGSVGVGYPLIREKLTLDGSVSTSFGETSRTLGANLGLTFRGGKHHTVALTLAALNARIDAPDNAPIPPVNNATQSMNEYRGVASYGYRF